MLGENKSGRALLVVDMTNDFAHIDGENYLASSVDIIPYLQGELQYFRERMRPVVFCNTIPNPKENSPNDREVFRSQVIQSLSPRTQEVCISKKRPNAFFDTRLSDLLGSLKVKTLTIVGAMTSTSIINTAAAALDHGFEVVVPETCVCAASEALQLAALRLIGSWMIHE